MTADELLLAAENLGRNNAFGGDVTGGVARLARTCGLEDNGLRLSQRYGTG